MDGTDICKLKAQELSEYRRDRLGFVFQFYNLVLNDEQNDRCYAFIYVLLVRRIRKIPASEILKNRE